MNERNVIEKIYRKLNRELNEAENAELEQYLSVHPESALLLSQWKEVDENLAVSQDSAEIPDLKASILQRINKEKYLQKAKNHEIKIVHLFWKRPFFQVGLGFVAGIFFGILLFGFLTADFESSQDQSDKMRGTLYNAKTFNNLKFAEQLQYDGADTKATCSINYSDKIIEVSIKLASVLPVQSIIEFDTKDFEILNVQNVQLNELSSVLATAGSVRITGKSDNLLLIQLSNKNSSTHKIAFNIFQNDKALYQNSITVNK